MVPHGLFVCLVFGFLWKEFIPWLTEGTHAVFSIPRWVDVNVYGLHSGESYRENRKGKAGKPTGTRCQGYVSLLGKQFLCRARALWGLKLLPLRDILAGGDRSTAQPWGVLGQVAGRGPGGCTAVGRGSRRGARAGAPRTRVSGGGSCGGGTGGSGKMEAQETAGRAGVWGKVVEGVREHKGRSKLPQSAKQTGCTAPTQRSVLQRWEKQKGGQKGGGDGTACKGVHCYVHLCCSDWSGLGTNLCVKMMTNTFVVLAEVVKTPLSPAQIVSCHVKDFLRSWMRRFCSC